LTAGQPNINLPSNNTIFRDINASFEKCQDRIAKLLQEHPGHLHFATDAWTSPNHRAFVAWMVHLEYEGEMLSFLLDIIELPEVWHRLF
jgi:antibiotic biosynthesis monooxygenase (ABM) superfamily enzyme